MTVAAVVRHALPIVAVSSVVVGAVASTVKLRAALVPVVPARFRWDATAVYAPVASVGAVVDQAPATHGAVTLAVAAPVIAMRTVPADVVHVPSRVGAGEAASEPSVGSVIVTAGTLVSTMKSMPLLTPVTALPSATPTRSSHRRRGRR